MLSHTLFISDLHLSDAFPNITAYFLNFIKYQAPLADALYILGDFFEAWIGDDNLDAPFNQQIINTLRELVANGTPVYFMRGNRDLLIGQSFAKASGVILLQDPTVLQLYNQHVLLTHGDCLCTSDIRYQWYRYFVNQRWVQQLLLRLIPLKWRKALIRKMREKSKHRNQRLAPTMMDATEAAIKYMIQKYGVSLLIHGHTHHPGIHDVPELKARRIVLGAWYEGASILQYFENGEFVLSSPSLPQPTQQTAPVPQCYDQY